MTTLTVEGMHCDACKKLIMMELEDAGLDTYVENVTVASTEKKGIFQLNEAIDEDSLEKMKSIINAMDGYSVE
ncbi:MAG: hypothetical protein COU32_02325 [Candidatus Magasanikbacteria bacterium CG10_big_fil_rev_8_21_14_0_10_42_10]|uniref:Uncharacterized protein n=2 Tax=Candidatus Magasanikiibacteriota TaxID=1752731 RepID=A0A2H0TW74_9BACT|nr:MAG: hypothetical protein COU32_02325 [Candidatus Magasanikbacteria bacterium CG10_big_fil_rev_8_21_14_0_10_42_10]PIZ93636.1 MAG: hypothetical protein COX82_02315 [Candidatus Magasanikbacteria bacterium CG_4_10_14_0_2_um_filter_41_10]